MSSSNTPPSDYDAARAVHSDKPLSEILLEVLVRMELNYLASYDQDLLETIEEMEEEFWEARERGKREEREE